MCNNTEHGKCEDCGACFPYHSELARHYRERVHEEPKKQCYKAAKQDNESEFVRKVSVMEPFEDGTYTYIVKTHGFDDVVEVANSSKQAKYKAFKYCRAAGYCYSWLEFQKQVISAKRFKVEDLEC